MRGPVSQSRITAGAFQFVGFCIDDGERPVLSCFFIEQIESVAFGIKEVDIKTYKDVPLNHPNGLSEKTVISLYEDETGILWIGTDGGGINSYHPRQNRLTSLIPNIPPLTLPAQMLFPGSV